MEGQLENWLSNGEEISASLHNCDTCTMRATKISQVDTYHKSEFNLRTSDFKTFVAAKLSKQIPAIVNLHCEFFSLSGHIDPSGKITFLKDLSIPENRDIPDWDTYVPIATDGPATYTLEIIASAGVESLTLYGFNTPRATIGRQYAKKVFTCGNQNYWLVNDLGFCVLRHAS
jgi:hypothetical protein